MVYLSLYLVGKEHVVRRLNARQVVPCNHPHTLRVLFASGGSTRKSWRGPTRPQRMLRPNTPAARVALWVQRPLTPCRGVYLVHTYIHT